MAAAPGEELTALVCPFRRHPCPLRARMPSLILPSPLPPKVAAPPATPAPVVTPLGANVGGGHGAPAHGPSGQNQRRSPHLASAGPVGVQGHHQAALGGFGGAGAAGMSGAGIGPGNAHPAAAGKARGGGNPGGAGAGTGGRASPGEHRRMHKGPSPMREGLGLTGRSTSPFSAASSARGSPSSRRSPITTLPGSGRRAESPMPAPRAFSALDMMPSLASGEAGSGDGRDDNSVGSEGADGGAGTAASATGAYDDRESVGRGSNGPGGGPRYQLHQDWPRPGQPPAPVAGGYAPGPSQRVGGFLGISAGGAGISHVGGTRLFSPGGGFMPSLHPGELAVPVCCCEGRGTISNE